MKARPRNHDRLSRIKGQFIDLLDEMDIWLDETHEDSFCAELFNFSFQAAEFAAVLGFDRPPCEHIPLDAGHHRRFSDIRDEAVNTKICVHQPFGMQGLSFCLEGPLGEALMAEANARLHSELRAWARRWKRAVERVDVVAVRPASTTTVDYTNSQEAMLFDEQRLREIVGDPTSFSEEIQANMAEVMCVAKSRGLTPAENQSLIGERATALWNEAEKRRQELGELKEAGTEASPMMASEPNGQSEPARTPVNLKHSDDAWLSHVSIAKMHDLDSEKLRKRLDRYRNKDHECFREISESERNPREPKYLYRLSKVTSIIESLRTSSGASGERPAK